MSVEVEYTGVTTGIVLQTIVDEVDRLVRVVEEVTREVLVFVLVTRGWVSVSVFVLDRFWIVHLPT